MYLLTIIYRDHCILPSPQPITSEISFEAFCFVLVMMLGRAQEAQE